MTVIWTVALAVPPFEFDAVTVNILTPDIAVGVPVITPVPAAITRPAGSEGLAVNDEAPLEGFTVGDQVAIATPFVRVRLVGE